MSKPTDHSKDATTDRAATDDDNIGRLAWHIHNHRLQAKGKPREVASCRACAALAGYLYTIGWRQQI